MAGGQVQERIRSSVLNEELGALFERNRKLLDQAGVAPALAERFLEQPLLSPTHKSAITEYVAFMEGVGNRGALVEAALDARNEVEALGKVQVARMYAYYHSEFTPLRELVGGRSPRAGGQSRRRPDGGAALRRAGVDITKRSRVHRTG